jgi:hypothetical protein
MYPFARTSSQRRARFCLRLEQLEDRLVSSAPNFGAMGDSYTAPYSLTNSDGTSTGIYNWVELGAISGVMNFGAIAQFPSGDPRHGVAGWGYTNDFALGGAKTSTFVGSGNNQQTGSPLVNNRFRQMATGHQLN